MLNGSVIGLSISTYYGNKLKGGILHCGKINIPEMGVKLLSGGFAMLNYYKKEVTELLR